MARMLLLDTGPLGEITHPKASPEARRKLRTLLQLGYELAVPDVCDYELRRKLIHLGKAHSERKLDQVVGDCGLVEITPALWKDAAALWAKIRKAGRPTAPPASLDADAVLAAEALAHRAAILTTAPADLAALIGPENVVDWRAL